MICNSFIKFENRVMMILLLFLQRFYNGHRLQKSILRFVIPLYSQKVFRLFGSPAVRFIHKYSTVS